MTHIAIPEGTTHIKINEKGEHVKYYKLTPFTFNDGTPGTRIEYFNYDWMDWTGCVNTYDEILRLIRSKDKSIIPV